MSQPRSSGKSPAIWGTVTVLLIIAIAGTLWVPIYAHSMPKLGAFPFFYWFQLIWVPITAVLSWICYLLLKNRRAQGTGPRHGANHGANHGATHGAGGRT